MIPFASGNMCSTVHISKALERRDFSGCADINKD